MDILFESGINGKGKLENLDALYYGLVNKWYGYWLTYKGNKYFLCSYEEARTNMFTIGRTWLDEGPFEYETFDELLDNFKEDGKSLREFVADVENLRHELIGKQNSYHLTYKGRVYYLCRHSKKGEILFALLANPDFDEWDFENYDLEKNFISGLFDSLLDNFKVDGRKLREFIHDAEIEANEYDPCILEYILEIVEYLNKK